MKLQVYRTNHGDGECDIVISNGEIKIKVGTEYEFGSPKDDLIKELQTVLNKFRL